MSCAWPTNLWKGMRKFLYISVLTILLAPACTPESLRNLITTQETRIETIVNAQRASDESYSVVVNEGTTRLIVVPGEGEELTDDKLVSFYYAGYVLTGNSLPVASTLFATNNQDVAQAARWTLTTDEEDEDASGEDAEDDPSGDPAETEVSVPSIYEIYTVKLSEAGFVKGLYNGMVGVRGGEECWIFFSAVNGFGSKKTGTIPANSALAYHIWVHSVQSDEL